MHDFERPHFSPGLLSKLILWLVLMIAAPTLFAQGSRSGVLTGTVTASGERLQGVVVEAIGPRSPRQAVTDAEGRFRFLALEAGTYDLRAALLELKAEAKGVTVFAGRTLEVDLALDSEETPAPTGVEVEEWIQVIAEAPVIDRYETRVGANITFELIDELPVERFYQSFALMLPGVSGGEDGNPNTSGALRSSNLYLVDGVDTTDPTTGLFGLNLSYEAVQEVQVTTAAPEVDHGGTSGAVINVVTRSGGARLGGGVRWVSGEGSLRDDYQSGSDRNHLRRELEAVNSGPTDPDSTLSLNLGGPLVAERLWLFGAHQDSSSSFLRPTVTGAPWDQDSEVESSAFKLSWQPDARHTVIAQHTRDAARFVTFDPFSRGPAELQLPEVPGGASLEDRIFQPVAGEFFALEDNEQRGRFSKIEWTAALGQNFSLGITLAQQERTLERGARNARGLTADAPHAAVLLDPRAATPEEGDFVFFLFNGITEEGLEERPRDQANIVAERLWRRGRVEHEFKAGIDFQETESRSLLNVAGADGIDPATGIPVAGQLFIDFDFSDECFFLGQCRPFDPNTGEFQPVGLLNFWRRPPRLTREDSTAVYISDTLSTDRWVVSLGARWETVEGEDGDGQPIVDDSNIAPRVAVSFDPAGRGETVLSFAWGQYYEPFLQQYLDAYGLVEPLSGYTDYERLETANGIDCSLVDPAQIDSPCWFAFAQEPFVTLLAGSPNQRLERSRVEEWVVGFERQVTPEIGLSLHWVDRRWRDLWNGVETLSPQTGDVTVQVLNIPEAERSYRGLQVLLQKRFADNWQLLASYTWSETEGNLFRADGLDSFGDFGEFVNVNQVNRFGPAPYDRPHQLRVHGTRRWSWGRNQLTLGTVLQYRDGTPYQLEQFEFAGIRFLTPRGSERLPAALQWDLALTWDWRLASQLELELKTEVLNVTDEQEIQGVETLVDTGRAGLPRSVDDIQSPRAYRFTLGLRF